VNWQYTDEEWQEVGGDRPFEGLDQEDLLLLHRQWIWCTTQRELFYAELEAAGKPEPGNLAEKAVGFMYLWYALLWSVIEACLERGVEFRGRMSEDIDSIADGLRRCRNAVFHVSRKGYYDPRLSEFMKDPDSAPKLRRINSGLGRLFLEEFAARGIERK
jgi:hypothetical protein